MAWEARLGLKRELEIGAAEGLAGG